MGLINKIMLSYFDSMVKIRKLVKDLNFLCSFLKLFIFNLNETDYWPIFFSGKSFAKFAT